MPALVALRQPAGNGFLDALDRIWAAGDAVLVIDPRLPPLATDVLLRATAPSAIQDGDDRHALRNGIPVEEGDAIVMATSGTTNEPKGVVLTHQALRASAHATSQRLAVDPDRDRWVACLPLAHIGGLAVVVRARLTGTPVTILEGFDPTSVEKEARSGATLISLVATALRRVDASGYRAVLLGGAAPPEVLPENVVTTYGMTETGSGIVYDGRPLHGVDVAIGDGQRGLPGEVLVRGPMLLRSYRDGTDPKLPGGWLPTGDSGSLDAAGRLTVHGRMAEVIVTGAEKVWPAAVEHALARHPQVAEVAVWKRPDPEWGERVVAWVVPLDAGQPPRLDSLRALVRTTVSPWAAPKELVLIDTLPRTPSGKVRRAELR